MEEMSAEFYQAHLDRVSRSFAFCIRQLPQPMRNWVGLSYLLCRIVDTIEDAEWTSPEGQQTVFQMFDEALLSKQRFDDLLNWVSRFPDDLVVGEKRLLQDAPQLFADFHALPVGVQEVIRELTLSMSRGMQHFCRSRTGGLLRLQSLPEVNQYCFFVAGVVGEILAKLMAKVEPRFDLSQANLLLAYHFGLFLQKVNLLKDQVADEKVGRHLIPSRDLVESSSQENAAGALNFLLQVPVAQHEFRRFCAWSLFLGLEALNVARESVRQRMVLKVPRQAMQQILERVETALADDHALRALFADLTQKLGWPLPQSKPSVKTEEMPAWFFNYYKGLLNPSSLRELGVAQ